MPFDVTYVEPEEEGLVFILQGFQATGKWWATRIEHEHRGCEDGVCTARYDLPPGWECIYVVGRYVRPGDPEALPPTLSEISIQSNMLNRDCTEGPPVPVPEISFLLQLAIGSALFFWWWASMKRGR